MDKRKLFLLIILMSVLLLINLMNNFATHTKRQIEIRERPVETVITNSSVSDSSNESEDVEKYSFHPQCNCFRTAPNLAMLENNYAEAAIESAKTSSTPWLFPKGTYVGNSTCNRYTSAIGSGQKVLSYTYYTPWRAHGGRFRADGRPNDQSSTRYAELLQPLARAIKEMYPGWRMRIYHNVTLDDSAIFQVWNTFCNLYCQNES